MEKNDRVSNAHIRLAVCMELKLGKRNGRESGDLEILFSNIQ